jgi:hypothetical protein
MCSGEVPIQYTVFQSRRSRNIFLVLEKKTGAPGKEIKNLIFHCQILKSVQSKYIYMYSYWLILVIKNILKEYEILCDCESNKICEILSKVVAGDGAGPEDGAEIFNKLKPEPLHCRLHFQYSAFPANLILTLCNTLLRSRSRKEPHLLVGSGAGAGAVTRCCSGSGSDNGIYHG